MQTVKKIGVDLDHASLYDLLREYFKAELMFPDCKKEVFLSSSGSGYHIEIEKELPVIENFLVRAHFNDCPMRLRFNLQKYFIDKNEEWNDLLFQKKAKGERKLIELAKRLKKYPEETKRIMETYGSNEAMEMMVKLAEKMIPLVRGREHYYVFGSSFNGEINKENIKMFANWQFQKSGIKYKIFHNYFNDNKKYIFTVMFDELADAKKYQEKFNALFPLKNWIKTIKRRGEGMKENNKELTDA